MDSAVAAVERRGALRARLRVGRHRRLAGSVDGSRQGSVSADQAVGMVWARPTPEGIQTPRYSFCVRRQSGMAHADPWSSEECRFKAFRSTQVYDWEYCTKKERASCHRDSFFRKIALGFSAMLILASIPPVISRLDAHREIGSEYQLACIDSWIDAGFEPVSVNATCENLPPA